MNPVLLIVLTFIAANVALKLWLERINRRYTLAHADAVPPTFRDTMDPQTYRKSVDYTLAKSHLHTVEIIIGTVVLALVLLGGLLPKLFDLWSAWLGASAWAKTGFLIAMGMASSVLALPLDWYAQFHMEERFGFNTTTPRIWWIDRVKGLCLSLLLGLPLLWLILKLVTWVGDLWWFWAWVTVLGFQLVMAVLAPVLILPLFNKFTPLPEGTLRQRLTELAQRTGFKAKSIQVMDGSKRSRHSNAFFIGFGRFRKIVFFDTLIEQLDEGELEAVLAHEIGHYKKKHIPKMLVASAVSLLIGLFVVAWLAKQEWFFAAFGFKAPDIAVALLLFALLSGVFTVWFSPLLHWWSRRYEYQADAFAAASSDRRWLIGALRKLSAKNLSNLTPHPLYSRFYYSHPTLTEREAALQEPGAQGWHSERVPA
jgi:STE24 endopeptidase